MTGSSEYRVQLERTDWNNLNSLVESRLAPKLFSAVFRFLKRTHAGIQIPGIHRLCGPNTQSRMTQSHHLAVAYQHYDQYPLNHVTAPLYGIASLHQHRRRLWIFRDHMFVTDANGFQISVRNVSAAGTVSKVNLFNDDELRDYLGPIEATDDDSMLSGRTSLEEEGKCRFLFLRAQTTAGPLELHPRMLFRLLSFYQVMPHFLDFLYVYASPFGEDRELRFSGFRTEKTLVNPAPGTESLHLGRSGRKYSLCFNLKNVATKDDGNWKIRQAAIHHHFDVGQGSQLWMFGDPHASLKDRIGELFSANESYPTSFSTLAQGFQSSLTVHLACSQWAASEWRWHVRFLEQLANEVTLNTTHLVGQENDGSFKEGSLDDMQRWEEKTNETITAMESNASIMTLLQKFYRDLVDDEHFPDTERPSCRLAFKSFAFQIDELTRDTHMQMGRAKVLLRTVADRKAIHSSKLTASAYTQANRSAVEAIAVRIVTIVTLIYLPATFSCTFFGTDVIKYEDGEKYSSVALERFLEVTIPLMLFTFCGAGTWFLIEYNRRYRTPSNS